MKFRTIKRLMFLKRARHRRGHGIHSPFLFHLITTVVENKQSFPEYALLKKLKKAVQNEITQGGDFSFDEIYRLFNLAPSNPKKLIKKVEMPTRYTRVIFRLIREFKPGLIINYGPSFGLGLALTALSKTDSQVVQVFNHDLFEPICSKILGDTGIQNICYCLHDSEPLVNPGFVTVNYPGSPEMATSVVEKILMMHDDDCVLIIRGIHESKGMRQLWKKVMAAPQVRVSLDLFEIGIVLFRKGLQKENFIHLF